MVLASHVIFTTYGFWLPNDPRGSWSDFVGSWELFHFGPATTTTNRRSVAHLAHDRQRRLAAKRALKYPPVEFAGLQARCIANAFAEVLQEANYTVYACSILPRHVHAVLKRHQRDAEDIVGHLKFAATRKLLAMGMHPFASLRGTSEKLPTVWTKRSWRVYLDSAADIDRAVGYVENNPVKERKKPQHWNFITPWVSSV